MSLMAGSGYGQRCSALFYTSGSTFQTGDTIMFHDSSIAVSSSTQYSWAFGDGSGSRAKNSMHSYSQPGTYYVCLTIQDTACRDTFCDSVVISGIGTPPCKADFSYYVDSLDSCKIHFYNTSTNVNSSTYYYWSYGDATTGFGSSTTHQYSGSGSFYTVTLNIYNSAGCTSSYSDTIYVSGCSTPNPCKADYSYYVDSLDSCKIHFYSTSTGVNSSTQYSWSFGNGSYGYGMSAGHQYTATGWYLVTLNINDSSRCSSSYTDSIYVVGCDSIPPCSASFYSYIDTLDSCKIHFVSASTGTTSSTSYSWSFGDSNSGSGSSTSHQYSNSGWYAVTLTIVDSVNNCYSTYTDSVFGNGCGKGSKCRLSISGQVFTGTSSAQQGTVYLIEKRGNNLFAVDTTYIDSMGYYYFGGVCSGDYFVKAALGTSDPSYTDYLPTYHGDELRWSNATVLSVSNAKQGIDINMTRGTNPGGPGFVKGNVKKGANKKAGEALENVQIMVLDADFKAVAYTYSNKEGEFEIAGLGFGQYVLIVDVPGLKSNEFWFNLSEDEKGVEDVVIEVNENDIVTFIERTVVDWSSDLELYPNPMQNSVRIIVGDGFVGDVSIFDLTGGLKWTGNVSDRTEADLSELSSGMYILKVSGTILDRSVAGQKVLIKN